MWREEEGVQEFAIFLEGGRRNSKEVRKRGSSSSRKREMEARDGSERWEEGVGREKRAWFSFSSLSPSLSSPCSSLSFSLLPSQSQNSVLPSTRACPPSATSSILVVVVGEALASVAGAVLKEPVRVSVSPGTVTSKKYLVSGASPVKTALLMVPVKKAPPSLVGCSTGTTSASAGKNLAGAAQNRDWK